MKSTGKSNYTSLSHDGPTLIEVGSAHSDDLVPTFTNYLLPRPPKSKPDVPFDESPERKAKAFKQSLAPTDFLNSTRFREYLHEVKGLPSSAVEIIAACRQLQKLGMFPPTKRHQRLKPTFSGPDDPRADMAYQLIKLNREDAEKARRDRPRFPR